jgi:hypothetical protein
VALSATVNALAALSVYGALLLPSVELALPPAPALPVSLEPPLPAVAFCVNDNAPLVLPETAFVTLSPAPWPPAAPEAPAPPSPPNRYNPTLTVPLPDVPLAVPVATPPAPPLLPLPVPAPPLPPDVVSPTLLTVTAFAPLAVPTVIELADPPSPPEPAAL